MAKTQKSSPFLELIGREKELSRIGACVSAGRSVLLEGPVGVGKTHLALAAIARQKRRVFRVDGDSRYTEQKLTGWFDPPTVLKKGFSIKSFMPGPLLEAMQTGGVLFINEMNRLPEGVQNVLLPALDEKAIFVPKLGEMRAKPGFLVIATQNPKEFVATSHLSEAILDRFELVLMPYQTEVEETLIVVNKLVFTSLNQKDRDAISGAAVRLVRTTRDHPRIRRGASIRAAIAIGELTASFMKLGHSVRESFLEATLLALPTRIEMERDSEPDTNTADELESLVKELAEKALSETPGTAEKKK